MLTTAYLYLPFSVASDGKGDLNRPQHFLPLILIPGKVFLTKRNLILLLLDCDWFSYKVCGTYTQGRLGGDAVWSSETLTSS